MNTSINVRHSGHSNPKPNKTLTEQQEERRRQQVAVLAQLDCLHNVPSLALLRLASLCTLRAFVPGSLIINERIAGAFMYLILRGTVSLTLHDRAGHEVLIGVLNRGDCFGEGPLFGDLFRGATAQAETVCYLLQLPLAEMRLLLAETPELATALRVTYRHRLAEGTLGRVPLLSALLPLERTRIAALLQPQHHERGALIIQQGSSGDALYLIESGQVVVEQDEHALAYLDEGDFFGEMSLLTNQPHNANIRAISPVDILALPATEFTRLLDQQPELAAQLHEVVERRRASSKNMQSDQIRSQELATAVERGVLRGARLIIRDPHLCPDGCHICEDACASRYGYTRIHTNGVLIDGLDVTDTCRQCRVGAECVEACPEDAIKWNDRGALIITDRCNGCGACVPACPYDAVQRIPHASANGDGPLWSLWGKLKRMKAGTIPLEPIQPTYRANKCDLCHGYDDMACISACPTGALKLVPVEEMFPL